MSTARIQALLDTQLKTIVGLPALQLENVRYTLNGDPFVRSTLMPARSSVLSLGVGATKQLQGLYQVTCFYAQDGGSAPARAMADTVVDTFPIGLRLSDGVITVIVEIASVLPAMSMTNLYGVPVQVQWSVYA
jgi:hypothetical protein